MSPKPQNPTKFIIALKLITKMVEVAQKQILPRIKSNDRAKDIFSFLGQIEAFLLLRGLSKISNKKSIETLAIFSKPHDLY